MVKKSFSLPRLIILTGAPGTGKTTLSTGLRSGNQEGLVNKIQMVYLNKDSVNNAFTSKRDKKDDIYKTIRGGSYKVMDNIARDNLSFGNSVLIEGTFRGQSDFIEHYKKLSKKTGAILKVIRTVLPEKILYQRLKQRGYQRDLDKLENWDNFLKEEPIKISLPVDSCEVDMSLDFKENVRKVMEFLNISQRG